MKRISGRSEELLGLVKLVLSVLQLLSDVTTPRPSLPTRSILYPESKSHEVKHFYFAVAKSELHPFPLVVSSYIPLMDT